VCTLSSIERVSCSPASTLGFHSVPHPVAAVAAAVPGAAGGWSATQRWRGCGWSVLSQIARVHQCHISDLPPSLTHVHKHSHLNTHTHAHTHTYIHSLGLALLLPPLCCPTPTWPHWWKPMTSGSARAQALNAGKCVFLFGDVCVVLATCEGASVSRN